MNFINEKESDKASTVADTVDLEQIKMDKERVDGQIASAQATINSASATAKSALSSIDDKMKEIDDMFRAMNKAFAEKMQAMLGGGFKGIDDYKMKPQQCTPQEAAKHLVGKKKVAILTGAGVSAGSGIPTFRGQEGFWNEINCGKYAGASDPKDICTKTFFAEHPEAN